MFVVVTVDGVTNNEESSGDDDASDTEVKEGGANDVEEDDSGSDGEELLWEDELNWKKNHPERLHEEMWFNLVEEVCAYSLFNPWWGERI